MRFVTKAAIMTAFAGPAIAALMLTGAGPANAAVTTTSTAHTTSTSGFNSFCFNNHFQNPFNQREQWNLSGWNTVVVPFDGQTFYYSVWFNQRGSCLSGTLSDPKFLPSGTSGPIHGTVFRNYVTFSFTYPSGSSQGTRTFTGTIDRHGDVSGMWKDYGSDKSTGTWSLTRDAHRACHRYLWWDPNQECFIF